MTTELLVRLCWTGAVLAWIAGVWSYAQMVRHRRPGVPPFEVSWRPDRLDAEGLRWRHRVLLCWALVLACLVAVVVVARAG